MMSVFHANLPALESRPLHADVEDLRRKAAHGSSFWRGLMIGFVSAFTVFDLALNGGATVRAAFHVVGIAA